MTASFAARAFASLVGLVCAFQLGLALGAPWGEFAMGGASPGAYPPLMRIAALLQIFVLLALALIILCRAGVMLPSWQTFARPAAWVVVVLLGGSVLLNLISPSRLERLIWTPVAVALFVTAVRAATAR